MGEFSKLLSSGTGGVALARVKGRTDQRTDGQVQHLMPVTIKMAGA